MTNTITEQDYKQLRFYAEQLGDRSAVDEAMAFYNVGIGVRSNPDCIPLIIGYVDSQ